MWAIPGWRSWPYGAGHGGEGGEAAVNVSGAEFWIVLDELVAACELVIDRPRSSAHPRYASAVYPLDYGYLAGTTAADGGGLDVWRGSLPDRRVTAIVCTVDMIKRDAEIKVLLGCTAEEAEEIAAWHTGGGQAALLVMRPA